MKMRGPDAKTADGFAVTALHGVLPLIVWAAHFFLSYASAEVACALGLQRFALGNVAALSVWLWVISAAAIATLLVLTVVAVRHGRSDAESGSTQATVRIGAAILALIGVLWSAVPIAFVDGTSYCATR
jgi:hypothetical protein